MPPVLNAKRLSRLTLMVCAVLILIGARPAVADSFRRWGIQDLEHIDRAADARANLMAATYPSVPASPSP